jgi:signal transduction histidine kinase
VTNALRHARAREIRSEMTFAAGSVRLDFRDDGIGFDPAVRHDGFGLLGIRERVEDMGGELTIQSRPDTGTAVVIVLPESSPQTARQA